MSFLYIQQQLLKSGQFLTQTEDLADNELTYIYIYIYIYTHQILHK